MIALSLPACARWLLDLLGSPVDETMAGEPAPGPSLQQTLDTLALRLNSPSPELLALAELDDAGRVHSSPDVSSIQELLRSRGPLPTTLLVDSPRAAALRALPLPNALPSLRILGVDWFADALSSGLRWIPPAQEGQLWADDLEVGWTVERLFSLALESRPIPCGWRFLAALAVGLARRFPLEHSGGFPGRLQSAARWKLAFVRDVSLRHAGESARMAIPEPEILDAFPSEVRWQILAHTLQSASDSDLPSTREYTDSIAPFLLQEVSTLSPSKTRLRGALGRALAAAGSYGDAEVQLRQAIQDWQRMSPVEASYPLCELLRILGIQGKREPLRALHSLVHPFLAQPSVACAFVGLAWGRALVQCGEILDGLATLSSDHLFSHAPSHALASRYRWLAAAQRLSGHSDSTTLDLLLAMGDLDQLHLARLDAVLEAGRLDELDPHAQALLVAAEGANEALLALSRLAPGQEPRWAVRDPAVLALLCSEYRY